jgi:hypothetical protein
MRESRSGELVPARRPADPPIFEVANLPQGRHRDKPIRQRRCRSLAVNQVRLKEDWETQNV